MPARSSNHARIRGVTNIPVSGSCGRHDVSTVETALFDQMLEHTLRQRTSAYIPQAYEQNTLTHTVIVAATPTYSVLINSNNKVVGTIFRKRFTLPRGEDVARLWVEHRRASDIDKAGSDAHMEKGFADE